jgi:hypothetical protein
MCYMFCSSFVTILFGAVRFLASSAYIGVRKLFILPRPAVNLYVSTLLTSGEVVLIDGLVALVASKMYWGNSGLAPYILNFDIRCSRMVFMLRLLYPLRKSSHYVFCSRLGGPQSQSGHIGKRRIFCFCWESNTDLSIVHAVT